VNLAAPKPTSPPVNSAAPKPTLPPTNLAWLKPTFPDSGKPHCRLGVPELGSDRGEPLVEHASAVMNRISLADLLPPVGHNQRHQGTGTGDRREHQLQYPYGVAQRDRAVLREPGMVQQGPRQPGQARQPERSGRETRAQGSTKRPQPHLTGIPVPGRPAGLLGLACQPRKNPPHNGEPSGARGCGPSRLSATLSGGLSPGLP
jgi:hypothetical protein